MQQQRGSGTATTHVGASRDIIPLIMDSERKRGGFELITLFVLSGIRHIKDPQKHTHDETYTLCKRFFPTMGKSEKAFLAARGELATFYYDFITLEDFPDEFTEDEYDDFLDNIDTYAAFGARNKRIRVKKLETIVDNFLEKKRIPPSEIDVLRFLKCVIFGMKNKDWYQNTNATFHKLLPRFGIKDIDLFIRIFAITSARTSFQANLWAAKRVYEMFHKEHMTFKGMNLLPAVANMLTDFKAGKLSFEVKHPPEERRKIVNFGKALLGDPNAVVCDSWLLDSFSIAEYYTWKDKTIPYRPRVYEYDVVEAAVREMGRQTELEPRQIASMAWAGSRILLGKHKEFDTERVLRSVFEK